MSLSTPISRRGMLKGLGTVVALPWLESLASPLLAASAGPKLAIGPNGMPLRMAFVYVPNGVHLPAWEPEKAGAEFDLPDSLKPLEEFKSDLMVMSGLTHQKAFANGDGGGDHARALATFLTGCQAKKTNGADIRAGVSVDQLAAQKVGKLTRFASLELGIDPSAQSGNCDSGYSCAYSSNIAWKSESQPLAKEINPRLAFERLFTFGTAGETAEARARRAKYNKSVLDFVMDDASRLKAKLATADQRKVEEYLTAVRELEQRISRSEKQSGEKELGGYQKPEGVPESNELHIQAMCDILALAFQTDSTRIATFVIANEGSNKSYPFLEVPEGHHDLSHHENNATKQAKLAKINKYHVTQFAHLLRRLKSTKEGTGNLLDNCMIVYGSGIGDGNRHNHNNLPVLMAGHAGGSVKSGRHLKLDKEQPMTNLYLEMLERMGVHAQSLGDSSGRLQGLDG